MPTERTAAAGSSRCRAMMGLDCRIRPEVSAICANTSSFSMRVGLTFARAGALCCMSEVSSSARERRPASMVSSRSLPIRRKTKTLRPPITTATLAAKATVSRPLIGRLAQRVISDPVADAADSLNRGPAERAVNLIAQRANVDLEDPGIPVGRVIPHLLDQLVPGEHVIGVPHEIFEQRELGRRQPDSGAAALHLVPGRVQR